MFNRGISDLLAALPTLADLNPSSIRRLLANAYLEFVDRQAVGGPGRDILAIVQNLRPLATALEVHAIIAPEVSQSTRAACAFVAAEALSVASEVQAQGVLEGGGIPAFGTRTRFEQVECGLLYLMAGYDANAAVTSHRMPSRTEGADPEGPSSERAMSSIQSFLEMHQPPHAEFPTPPNHTTPLRARVRHEMWRRITGAIDAHLMWLRCEDVAPTSSGVRDINDLISQMTQATQEESGRPTTHHADLFHLALLLAAAFDATSGRALRLTPRPQGDAALFDAYVRSRARMRPLLWPSAHEYAEHALSRPGVHAVVSVPTGAGKSAVAELAVAHAVRDGWVLYLAPTNALVGQVIRDLRSSVGELDGVDIRGFVGGAEYSELSGETVQAVIDRQILVMTPEKCSLALRQHPEAFRRMALCILDECHLLGEHSSRAVIAELVIAEVMHRAPHARLLLLSALVANPSDLAGWLTAATGTQAVVVADPWRPTRTLRAVVAFSLPEATAVAARAIERLQELPPSRRKLSFEVPIALLAGLQGAWDTTSAEDYALVATAVTVDLAMRREDNGTFAVDWGGHVNRTVAQLVQALGDHNQRVLTFLPRSRHDSFSVAQAMQGFDAMPLSPAIDALLRLCDYELGAESALRGMLRKGVAVHTSAMLRDEQRASELAFEGGFSRVLFATGTLGQGLNLPATAVVVGGTQIGYEPDVPTTVRVERERAQLLNAVGRAGRPYVASRAVAIVVPGRQLVLGPDTPPVAARDQAEFLRYEDASTEVRSQLGGLVEQAIDGTLDMSTMSLAEQAAFAFLSFAENEVDGPSVLRRSYGAYRVPGAMEQADVIFLQLRRLGTTFLGDAGVPTWVAAASHRAGITLPEAAALYRSVTDRLQTHATPSSILSWKDLLLAALREIPPALLDRLVSQRSFKSTQVQSIFNEGGDAREPGWLALDAAVSSWLSGETLLRVAEAALGRNTAGLAGRGARDPLPKAIAIVGDGFGFGLSLAAGAVSAIISVGAEAEPDGPWGLEDEAKGALNLLPIAIRLGGHTPGVLAWMRAGFRQRRAAHMLARLLPPPSTLGDEQVRGWVRARRQEITSGSFLLPGVTDEERALIGALALGPGL